MQVARAEPIRLTYDDFVNFPDDGRRHELIDGEHFVTPAPVLRHQELLGRLYLALGNHLAQHRAGKVYLAPADVVFSSFDVVEPDLLFVSNERLEILAETRLTGAPDLVVEILSPSTRRTDEIRKRQLYGRFDVREYWIVDPEVDAIKVYRRAADGTFPRVAELAAADDDRLQTPLLPGFSMTLRELFAQPD